MGDPEVSEGGPGGEGREPGGEVGLLVGGRLGGVLGCPEGVWGCFRGPRGYRGRGREGWRALGRGGSPGGGGEKGRGQRRPAANQSQRAALSLAVAGGSRGGGGAGPAPGPASRPAPGPAPAGPRRGGAHVAGDPLPQRAPAAPRGAGGGGGGGSSRDARRALASALPIGPEAIVNLPVEDFNALLGRARLSGPELALARDIRRRGKNKVAAQKCRRRKLEAIARLQAELGRLGRERERLLRARGQAERALGALRRDLARVSAQVLGALRDGAGNPLPPERFGLRLAPDGGLSLETLGGGE
uniref:BZIP domain-containing protein n=2 Tax=Accipitriformes TaxID=2558200 RepID=A0A8B9ME68_9AVES